MVEVICFVMILKKGKKKPEWVNSGFFNLKKKWCPDADSNHGHKDFQSFALPTELSGRLVQVRLNLMYSAKFVKHFFRNFANLF